VKHLTESNTAIISVITLVGGFVLVALNPANEAIRIMVSTWVGAILAIYGVLKSAKNQKPGGTA
jgi:hypothetical protein